MRGCLTVVAALAGGLLIIGLLFAPLSPRAGDYHATYRCAGAVQVLLGESVPTHPGLSVEDHGPGPHTSLDTGGPGDFAVVPAAEANAACRRAALFRAGSVLLATLVTASVATRALRRSKEPRGQPVQASG